MDTTQRGIITLIKSAVTEQSLPLPEGFDLAAAYSIVKRHHISTLIYDGAVRCGISRTEPIMQKLFGEYCKALLISERQMAEVNRVFAAFDAAGIDYMPLKGCLMKARYPKPELRMMGDADVLIRMEQCDRIAAVMKELGYENRPGASYEYVWETSGLHLELHKAIVAADNTDFCRYLGDGWRMADHCDGYRWRMSEEGEFIYLFIHFARHFRDGGIGCRHVLDLWVYLCNHPDLDMAYIWSELEKTRQQVFFDNILKLLNVWFADGVETDLTMQLTEYIFSGGSYGTFTSKAVSKVIAYIGKEDMPYSGRARYVSKRMFLGVDALREKYTVLKKAPWMLPLVWIYRPVYKVLCERKDVERLAQEVSAVSSQSISERAHFFRAIGLEPRK